MAFADQQANVRFLERMRESIDGVLSDGSMADGVELEACLGIIQHAKSFKDVLCSEDTDVILPGYEGLLRRPMRVDRTAEDLLNGGEGADGGGRGVPVKVRGNGACYFNAVPLGIFGTKCNTPDEALGLSLSVRVAVIRAAIVHFEEFISGPEYGGFYCTLQAYSAKEVKAAWSLGCDTPEVLTESVSRVLYLLAVREVAGEFSDSQQAAMPWTAQAFGMKMRCFHPGGSMKHVEGGASFAGKWSKELIGPLKPAGVEPTIYLTMCITSHKQAFSSIHEFTETTVGGLRQTRWMPEFNHWVLMLPPANASALQVRQKAKGAPDRAFVLDVKRAILLAKKAGANAAKVEAEAGTAESTAVPAEVDKAGVEERTRSLSATLFVTLFSMLSAAGGVAIRLPLLLPLAEENATKGKWAAKTKGTAKEEAGSAAKAASKAEATGQGGFEAIAALTFFILANGSV
ncbi:unnamed protein product [Ectocarpus sp. CCAP 1310/34]|nr:unnamed protein product [Ectocarpus sp. CCAP 1310/34]